MESGKWLGCESSGLIIGLTSTEPGRGRGSTESTGRTHAHGRSIGGWWWTKMLRTETETSRRGAAARFVSSSNLVDNALGLIMS